MNVISRMSSIIHPYQPPKIEGYTFENPYPQSFSFPSDMINHITFNPSSSKAWKKLIKTCKYVYSKNPIAISKHFYYYDNFSSWMFMLKYYRIPKRNVTSPLEYCKLGRVDVENIEYKLWLTKKFYLTSYKVQNLASIVIPKIYRCDVKDIWIEGQVVFLNELNFLGSSKFLKTVLLNDVRVRYSNGNVVLLEKIVEAFSTTKELIYRAYLHDEYLLSINYETAANLIKLLPTTSIKFISIEPLTDNFDFETIIDFMLKQHKICFYLKFAYELPADYKERLEEAVNKIIASRIAMHPIHGIFYGEDRMANVLRPLFDTFRKQWKIRYQYYKYKWFTGK